MSCLMRDKQYSQLIFSAILIQSWSKRSCGWKTKQRVDKEKLKIGGIENAKNDKIKR